MLTDLNQIREDVSCLQQDISIIGTKVSEFEYWLRHGNYLHSVVVRWNPVNVSAQTVVSGFVGRWNATKDCRVIWIQVWMGNPSGITWEGDVYVTKNATGNFQQPDTVLVHYQLDKHVESSIPHQLTFDLSPGVPVNKGEMMYVWRLFHNTSPTWTLSGDGEVIIYYVPDEE